MQTEKPKIKFSNISTVSKHLYCTCCLEIFNDPKRVSCGHTFCNACISTWLNQNSHCPLCRKTVNKKNMTRDLIAYNIINDLEVYCNNTGCPWKSSLLNLNQHLQTCYFDPSRIPDHIKSACTIISPAKTNVNDEENEQSSNSFLAFNGNVGLKARLYNKNKALMENVFTKTNESCEKINNSLSQKRDSLLELLTNY